MAGQEGGQCSIGRVKLRLTFWRRSRPSSEAPTEPAEDPRAEELRRKLDESRAVVEEQHEQAAEPETPVDEAPDPPATEAPDPSAGEAPDPPVDPSVEERRAEVHERARAAADEMRRED
jgi:hypothetical protein